MPSSLYGGIKAADLDPISLEFTKKFVALHLLSLTFFIQLSLDNKYLPTDVIFV